MLILALETAAEACSVALWVDGVVKTRFQAGSRAQTRLLLPMIDELLAEAETSATQLTAIAYSCGPGAFTGVRVAAAAAQGLALGWDLPVLTISSLQTLAQQVHRCYGHQAVISTFDARMDEIYWGAYQSQQGLMQPVGAEAVCPPAKVTPVAHADWVLAGSGCIYQEVLQQSWPISQCYPELVPLAEDVAALAVAAWQRGEAKACDLALPVYLRDSVWQKLPGR